MSSRSHPRVVGVFVLAAIALISGAVVALSGHDWFVKKDRWAVFFPGSVRGLNHGAPVTFRGVKIGEVKDVTALMTGKDESPIQIEVEIEIRRNFAEPLPGVAPAFRSADPVVAARQMTEAGLRGRLMSQSLLTGQKYIEFDFAPQEPARFAGIVRRYPELPTTPTALERMGERADQLVAKLAELPVDAMLEDVRQALDGLHRVTNAPELHRTLQGAAELGPALREMRVATSELRQVMARFGTEVDSTGGEARQSLAELRTTLERADATLVSLDALLRGTDETRMSAGVTLEELGRTLKALRNLVDYIQTHPEAVVVGKPNVQEER